MTDEIDRKIEQCAGQAEDASRCGQHEIQERRCGWVDALSWALRGPVKQLTAKLAESEARLAITRGLVEGSMAQTERAVTQAESASEKTERALVLLEGMTTEAKRHAARAEQLEAESSELELQRLRESAMATGRRVELESELALAHAHHMFGVDVDGPPADRVGALHYLRAHGLPEATLDDLDAACEGLVTPWGSGPRFDAVQSPVRTSYISINTDSSLDVVIDGQTVSPVYQPTPPRTGEDF